MFHAGEMKSELSLLMRRFHKQQVSGRSDLGDKEPAEYYVAEIWDLIPRNKWREEKGEQSTTRSINQKRYRLHYKANLP